MKKTILASTLGLAALGAHAQSSVTLYGIVDTGIGYQSSATSLGKTSGGHSLVKMAQGIWAGSRFGFKGSEDLGGGTRAIFQLEEGYNSATGAESTSGLMFSRAAFVGLANQQYGTLTAGRQYAPYYTLLSAYSPTNWLTGAYGAHPGDLDSMDTIYRINNALVYTSPNFSGFTFSGMYAFGGVAGSTNAGSSWSVAANYIHGPVGIAVGFERLNNATSGGGTWSSNSTAYSGGEPGVSGITNGFQTAQAQQRLAVTGGYAFNSQWDISASYSNVQYIAGAGSKFFDTQIWNTGGVVLHYKPFTVLDLAAGYSYTRATKANGITSAASYQQFNLSQYYSLSKRTGLYFVEAYQRAGGQTLGTNGAGDIINATADIGDGQNSAPASSRSQFAGAIGIIHRF
ncbi:porin [Paraburkholderia tropica]|uniref:porin n=1 Tax=Paraburkholderia tropica TaxID=92647 RepID=UPI0007ECF2A1|nr:porin [Paraburkholderia tropica]MBB2983922.1 putative porin [Paraburkholderia tropica]OBR47623.1 porin [Paraburkholderia tropica]